MNWSIQAVFGSIYFSYRYEISREFLILAYRHERFLLVEQLLLLVPLLEKKGCPGETQLSMVPVAGRESKMNPCGSPVGYVVEKREEEFERYH
jgi:hypothetical protein